MHSDSEAKLFLLPAHPVYLNIVVSYVTVRTEAIPEGGTLCSGGIVEPLLQSAIAEARVGILLAVGLERFHPWSVFILSLRKWQSMRVVIRVCVIIVLTPACCLSTVNHLGQPGMNETIL